MPNLFGGSEVLDELAGLTDNPGVLKAVAYLKNLIDAITNAGYGENVMIDLGLVQEIDYYTGLMFRGYMGGAGSGGRQIRQSVCQVRQRYSGYRLCH